MEGAYNLVLGPQATTGDQMAPSVPIETQIHNNMPTLPPPILSLSTTAIAYTFDHRNPEPLSDIVWDQLGTSLNPGYQEYDPFASMFDNWIAEPLCTGTVHEAGNHAGVGGGDEGTTGTF
jgi:hypothetical protein